MAKVVSYDRENDILAVHKGFSVEEKFKGNIDIGDVVLDISTQGRVVGIELINASTFLADFGIKKKMLESMKDASFTASVKPKSILISLAIKALGQEIPAKIAVPLEVRQR